MQHFCATRLLSPSIATILLTLQMTHMFIHFAHTFRAKIPLMGAFIRVPSSMDWPVSILNTNFVDVNFPTLGFVSGHYSYSFRKLVPYDTSWQYLFKCSLCSCCRLSNRFVRRSAVIEPAPAWQPAEHCQTRAAAQILRLLLLPI